MKSILILLSIIIVTPIGSSQIQIPLFSEPASLEQQIGYTHFRIDYERPKRNNRIIFGELVPFGKVWRTGSSACTKIYFDTAVTIKNMEIPAGCYSLFTIPNPDEWTIILNKDTSLYGAYDYDLAEDMIRFEVKPKKSSQWTEAFNINIDVFNDEAILSLNWEDISVAFNIKTNTYKILLSQVNEILQNDYDLEEGTYAHSADYILHNRSGFGADYIKIAEQLIDKAFNLSSGFLLGSERL